MVVTNLTSMISPGMQIARQHIPNFQGQDLHYTASDAARYIASQQTAANQMDTSDEITREGYNPSLSLPPDNLPSRGISNVSNPEDAGKKLGMFEVANIVKAALASAGVQKSQDLFQVTAVPLADAVKKVVDFAQTPAGATDEKQEELKQQRFDVASNILKNISSTPDTHLSVAADMLTPFLN